MENLTAKRSVTIYDIAKEADVSPSTVSRVISGRGAVSQEKREKIQRIIDKCEYTPNAFARGLQKSRSGIIGFVIPNIGNEYFATVYCEFEKHALEHGYMVAVYNGNNNRLVESKIFKRLEEARVEAIVIMGGRIDSDGLDEAYVEEVRMLNQRIPCILCTEKAKHFGCVGVHSDDRMGIRSVVQYLKKQNYKTVGFLGGHPNIIPCINKLHYLKEETKEHGLLLEDKWIIGHSFDEADGAESMKKLLELDELPEVVCCINDHVAIGAMGIVLDAGLRIPEDISIIGSDGIRLTEQIRPQLTTVAVDYETYGRAIFDMVQAKIEERECEAQQLISPRLVIRSTTT